MTSTPKSNSITIECDGPVVGNYGSINALALPPEFKNDLTSSSDDEDCIIPTTTSYPPLLHNQNNHHHHHHKKSGSRSRTWREEEARRERKQYLGLVLTLLSSLFSSLSALTVKLLEDDFQPMTICLWRFSTVLVASSSVLIYTKFCTETKIWPRALVEEKYDHVKNVFLLVVRGLLGCSARVLYIYSLTCMNLGDAVVIASSSPVFMTLFAYFLIGEKCGVVPVLLSFVTLVGVGVISRPPFLTGGEGFDHEIVAGTGTGIVGMILLTLVMIVMRRLRFIHHSVTTLSFAFFGVIITLSLLPFYKLPVAPTTLRQFFLLIASGLTSFLGQTFLTLGLKYENAGPVALIKNFDVVFAFIWSFVFLNVAPDVYSLGGGCIVIFCIIISTVRKWLGSLHEDDEIRQVFSIILK